jgi:hypothetical protein
LLASLFVVSLVGAGGPGEARDPGDGSVPDNVCNVVNIIPVVTRVDSGDRAGYGFEADRACGPHEGLGGWDQARQENPFGKGRDLGVCEDGTLAQDGQETDNVELEGTQVHGAVLLGLEPMPGHGG